MSVAYEMLASVVKYKFMAFDDAMQCYEKAIDDQHKPLGMDDKEWASRRSKICGEMAKSYNGAMHDIHKADECFRRAMDFDSNMAVYNDYSEFLRVLGRINEALALFENVVSKNDDERRLLEGSSILFIKNFIWYVHMGTHHKSSMLTIVKHIP